jgi:hypothetical protein
MFRFAQHDNPNYDMIFSENGCVSQKDLDTIALQKISSNS